MSQDNFCCGNNWSKQFCNQLLNFNMLDSNQEAQSPSTTNNELFLDFFNFDFNFEDQDKKKARKIIRQQETSQNQNFEYIPKNDYDGVPHYGYIVYLNTLNFLFK